MSALTYRLRYPHARRSTIQRLTRQDATTAALMADVRRMKRQKQLERIKRWFWRR